MTRQTILKEAHKVAQETSNGRSVAELSGLLQPRDIRRLGTSFVASAQYSSPGILVRRSCILINLMPVRALILHDRCLLFVPRGADSFLMKFKLNMRRVYESSNDSPFELVALECALITACEDAEKRLANLAPSTTSTVSEVVSATSGSTLEKLRVAKNATARLEQRMRRLHKAIHDTLDDDKDMSMMNLTSLHRMQRRYTEENVNEWESGPVEILLEHYLERVDHTLEQIEISRSDLLSAESSLMLRLDTARNNLLRVELMVTAITAVGAMGSLIAGLLV